MPSRIAAAMAGTFPPEDEGYNARLTRIEARLALLEAFRDKQAVALKNLGNLNVALQTDAALKSQAAQQQAQPPANLYAPLRSDTRAVLDRAAFVRRLLDPQDLGWAVNTEIRRLAREALGIE